MFLHSNDFLSLLFSLAITSAFLSSVLTSNQYRYSRRLNEPRFDSYLCGVYSASVYAGTFHCARNNTRLTKITPYTAHLGRQRQQSQPSADRQHSNYPNLNERRQSQTDAFVADVHVPYKVTIFPFPAGLPFATQIASFRSRMKSSTLDIVSRCDLQSDPTATPRNETRAYRASDMKSWRILQRIQMPPLLRHFVPNF
jgi:hypothetical protein